MSDSFVMKLGSSFGPVGLLVLQPVVLHLLGKVLYHVPLLLGVFVVVVNIDLLEVRRLGDGSVEPLPGDVRALVVEDGDGFIDGVALEGVAGPAVVMNEVLLIRLMGGVMALLSVIMSPPPP